MEVGKGPVLTKFIGANNSTQFVIPTYQRNYVWEKKNVEKLLNDIEDLLIKKELKNTHYLGTIVYINTVKKFTFLEETIIDGQQRLTTLFLILQALKYLCIKNDKKNEANIIIKKYLENDESIIKSVNEENGNYGKYRLKPLVDDDNVYEKIAKNQLDDIYENDSKIYMAFNIIMKRLENWLNNNNVNDILQAMDKLNIVWIQIEQEEYPQQIFESINSTGVGLTAADLIRNYVLMNKENEIQTQYYEEYWLPIEKNVQLNKLEEFFRFYISIKVGKTISLKEVYDQFKDYYNTQLELKKEQDVLKDIKTYSQYYKYISRIYDKNDKIEEVLKDYREVGSNMPHIILMKTFELLENNKINEQTMIETINLLISYIVRRNVCGKDTKSISNIFGGLNERIQKEFSKGKYSYYDCVVKNVVYLTKQNSQVMPTDVDLISSFLNENIYSRGLCRYSLIKIENNDNDLPLGNLSIEHVMPQTVTDYWAKQVNELKNYDNVINHIGNLTLVSKKDNSGMKNKNFITKKKYLAETKHLKLNEYILEKSEWNEKQINIRSKILAEKFIEIFKYPNIDKFKEDAEQANIIEDDIESLNEVVPNGVIIDDIIEDASNWTDVFLICIKKMYENDPSDFMKSYNKMMEKYNYSAIQISNKPEDLREPHQFSEEMYVEKNKSTKEKIKFLRQLYEGLSNDLQMNILYEK